LIGVLAVYVGWQTCTKQVVDNLFLVTAFCLSVIVFLYQQTCTMNWSFIFEQWLQNQPILHVQAIIYRLIYQCIYIAPLLLGLAFYLVISQTKRVKPYKVRLEVMGGVWIGLIGVVLIINPFALANLVLSAIIAVSALILSVVLYTFYFKS
jgi:hypothetical protein